MVHSVNSPFMAFIVVSLCITNTVSFNTRLIMKVNLYTKTKTNLKLCIPMTHKDHKITYERNE